VYQDGQHVDSVSWPSISIDGLPAVAFSHPQFQETALGWARSQGATVLRPAKVTGLTDGTGGSVTVVQAGRAQECNTRLVVGADGKQSVARRWVALILFQLAGRWSPVGGGRIRGPAVQDDRRLTTRYRVASAGTAVFLTGALWLVLAAGAVIGPTPLSENLLGVGVWVLVGLFALNAVGNLAERHPVERWGAGGITAVLTILCVWIAATR
jgi:hypothetical protein